MIALQTILLLLHWNLHKMIPVLSYLSLTKIKVPLLPVITPSLMQMDGILLFWTVMIFGNLKNWKGK